MSFRTETLDNGLKVEFVDLSNRYFGDYWHVFLEARCRVPLTIVDLPAGEAERARRELGEVVEYVRRLERMGVATEALPAVRHELAESFLASARPYLESPNFPARLIAGRLAARRPQGRLFPVE